MGGAKCKKPGCSRVQAAYWRGYCCEQHRKEHRGRGQTKVSARATKVRGHVERTVRAPAARPSFAIPVVVAEKNVPRRGRPVPGTTAGSERRAPRGAVPPSPAVERSGAARQGGPERVRAIDPAAPGRPILPAHPAPRKAEPAAPPRPLRLAPVVQPAEARSPAGADAPPVRRATPAAARRLGDFEAAARPLPEIEPLPTFREEGVELYPSGGNLLPPAHEPIAPHLIPEPGTPAPIAQAQQPETTEQKRDTGPDAFDPNSALIQTRAPAVDAGQSSTPAGRRRTCSRCGQPGHRVTTCHLEPEDLRADRLLEIARRAQARQAPAVAPTHIKTPPKPAPLDMYPARHSILELEPEFSRRVLAGESLDRSEPEPQRAESEEDEEEPPPAVEEEEIWATPVRDRRRGSTPRPITLQIKTSQSNKAAEAAAIVDKLAHYTPGDDDERPRSRADCEDGERPCPFVSCHHHLYLDVNPESGSIKLNHPHLEPWEIPQTCALDVADRGGLVLEKVGELMNLTRERIRQVETRGLLNLRMCGEESLGADGAADLDQSLARGLRLCPVDGEADHQAQPDQVPIKA